MFNNVNTIPVEEADRVDLTYLRMAYAVALTSKDESTKNGAVLLSENGHILTCGFNDIPSAIEDTPERRTERPLKYEVIHHAEDSAIFIAARQGCRVEGSTLYVPWYACNKCAVAIITAGVDRIVGHKDIYGLNPRWDLTLAFQMFHEAGVQCDMISGKLNVKAFMDGNWLDL